jgi:hypothetical protein
MLLLYARSRYSPTFPTFLTKLSPPFRAPWQAAAPDACHGDIAAVGVGLPCPQSADALRLSRKMDHPSPSTLRLSMRSLQQISIHM